MHTYMPLKCDMCKLVHVHIRDTYVNIYSSYKITGINHKTKNSGIHALHITGICP